MVQASGGRGEGGHSCPGASVLERNLTSFHHSLLSSPASTPWHSGLLSYKNNLSCADGERGGWAGASSRTLRMACGPGVNRAEDSDGKDAETIWAQRIPVLGPVDQGTWGPKQDRLSGSLLHHLVSSGQSHWPRHRTEWKLQSLMGTWGVEDTWLARLPTVPCSWPPLAGGRRWQAGSGGCLVLKMKTPSPS